MQFEFSKDFAQALDANDDLASFRSEFFLPKGKTRDEQIYLTGNSLGLQPKRLRSMIETELEDWKKLGVEGHFHGKNPWFYYHHFFGKASSKIVGAKEHEVAIMNNLTVNLHLLLASFYRPHNQKNKILMEGGAFPSDQYVIETQAKHHNLNPDEVIIEAQPRAGEHHLRTEDILQLIRQNKDELTLVFFSGVQYYTGQVFDMKAITEEAHKHGILVGFDLAHAAGNVELKLHQWNVDFAAWCTYKYLNGGPGSVSGIYVHEKHGLNSDTFRLGGWWGHKESERFQMKKGFIPEPGAAGWQLSNAPVFNMIGYKASLEIFEEAGMPALVKKGKSLNSYLQYCVKEAELNNSNLEFEIITPEERGCQLSLLTNEKGKALFDYLTEHDVISDWREPNVIRMAPVPLYNNFSEIYDFGQLLLQFGG